MRGPRPPYGFDYTDEGAELVVSELEMGVVRRIFEMLGLEGLTMGEVQRRLNRGGIPTPMANDPYQENSGLWHKPTNKKLVLNDLYRPITAEEIAGASPALVNSEVVRALDPEQVYGLCTWGKRHQRMWRERGEDGAARDRYEMVPRPKEEWLAVPISLSDARLSRAHVDTARERIGQNGSRRPASTLAERFWQLSGGIARCAECGGMLSPKARPRPSGKIDSWYTCRQRYNSGPRDCAHTRMYRADVLEETVWRAVHNLLSDPERLQRQYDDYVERRKAQLRGDPGREVTTLAESLAKLERRRSRLIDLASDGTITREDLRAKLGELEEQRRELEGALTSAQARQDTIQRLQREREIVFGQFSAMRAIDLRNASPEEKRRVFQGLRVSVEVNKDGNVRISGVLDTDITELLPMGQHLREAPNERYARRFRHEVPSPSLPYSGVVALDTRRCRRR